MAKTCFVSIDVEHDPQEGGQREFKGVESLERILEVFKKFGVSATLFVTGEVLEKYPELVKKWQRDHEIACHSFTHRFWNTIGQKDREWEIDSFLRLYKEVFSGAPAGFRAPSHLIDEKGMALLEEKGFSYDSSVMPHYPFFKKYRGYRGRAPLLPYHPDYENIRKKGEAKILEIPPRGQMFGIPLAGVWMARLPFLFYWFLFQLYSPRFLTVNMHSWDIFGREAFLPHMEKILATLKKKNYRFSNGEQICKNFR